jgi:hypothetical protein
MPALRAVAAAFFAACAAAAAAPPTPACFSNEGIPGRFPSWPATYLMQDSTCD